MDAVVVVEGNKKARCDKILMDAAANQARVSDFKLRAMTLFGYI